MRVSIAAVAMLLSAAAAAAAIPLAPRVPQGTMEMPVLRAVDGDTIAVHAGPGEPTAGYLRLWGIDAPEIDTAPGRRARDALEGLLRDGRIRCTAVAPGGYGRMAVRCRARDGQGPDLARLLVEAGLAHDCPAFSHGYYRRYENARTRSLPPPRRSCAVPREEEGHAG